MSKNMTRKGLAFGAGFALVATGLAAMPAQAAEGDITLSPTTGESFRAFTTDPFSMTTSVNGFLPSGVENALAYGIDNPDQHNLLIDFNTQNSSASIDTVGFKSTGETVTSVLNTGNADQGIAGTTASTGQIYVDFEVLEITRLVISDMDNFIADAKSITITPIDDSQVTVSDVVNDSTADGLAEFEYGDGDVDISIEAWAEAGDSSGVATVDTAYWSGKKTVEFIDPASVSVISKIERVAGAAGSEAADFTVATALQTEDDPATTLNDGDGTINVGGVSVGDGEHVLVLSGNDATDAGIWTVGADGSGAKKTDYDDDADVSVGDLIYVEDGTFAGAMFEQQSGLVATQSFKRVDPNQQAVTFLNDSEDDALASTLRFSKPVNLDQVDLSKWKYGVESTVGAAESIALANVDLHVPDDSFSVSTANVDVLTPAGYSYTNKEAYGALVLRTVIDDNDPDDGATYKLQWQHRDDSAPLSTFESPGYQIVQNGASATAVRIEANAAKVVADDVSIGAHTSDVYPTTVRSGVNTVTFDAQVETTAGVAVKEANVPVLAVVTASSLFPAGETITVSGSTGSISKAKGTLVTSGVTDSDGKWSVAVTSSADEFSGENYTVEFYVLEQGGGAGTTEDDWNNNQYDTATTADEPADYVVTYASTDAKTLEASSEVLSGSSISVTFTIKDEFDVSVGTSGKGLDYSIELTAPDTDDLELNKVATDGSATFTFDNYLEEGESDVLTAKVYTGSSTSPKLIGVSKTLTLYSVTDVVGVNVADEITGVVVDYTDFVTGESSDGPTSGGKDYEGTVIDANGAGIPGAPVTIAAEGFQFLHDGKYFIDSVTLAADSSGGFKVEFWTHEASSTGIDLTATSEGVVGETTVKSAIPSGNGSVSVDNLSFTIDAPEVFVVNTTYRVEATLTDKWGNPLPGADIDFNGFASAQFNGEATASKVTDKDGKAVAYLRSLKDVSGISSFGVVFKKYDLDGTTSDLIEAIDSVRSDDEDTLWDESTWTNSIEREITFYETAADAPQSSTQKVNAGSFKGYVAVYALGYEGQRLSAKIGNDWVIVDPIVNNQSANLARVTDFTGAGVDIQVRIYIDRVLVDTIPLTTK